VKNLDIDQSVLRLTAPRTIRGSFCEPDRSGKLHKNSKLSSKSERRQDVKIRPLQDRVIVKRIEEEGKSKGGIFIPDTAKEKPQEGKVVAVGKGKVNDDGKITPLDVKVNDRVLFGKYSGSEINIDGEEHMIMREDDILGIIDK
jgi:chaperonin GroES